MGYDVIYLTNEEMNELLSRLRLRFTLTPSCNIWCVFCSNEGSNYQSKFENFSRQAKRDAYIQQAKNLLNLKVDSLKKIYPVVINTNVLDTIKVIDFKKSKWISLQVYKQSSNRMVIPIVDPAWGL